MQNQIRSLTLMGLCLLALAACSLKKTAEETATTTKELNDSTKIMKEKTSSLEAQMTYTFSYEKMIENLDRLFQSPVTLASDDRNADPELFLYAGATFKSMDFQFWKGQRDEDISNLDMRLASDAEILFVRVF